MSAVALLFPGQGAQQVGMGKDLFENSLAAREVFAEADSTLGYSVSQLCFEGPAAELQRTERSQPAILTTSVAAYRALADRVGGGLAPIACAGHSLGEYSALVAAGALAFADALRLVQVRGEVMAEAAEENPGSMAAIIGLTLEAVREACGSANGAGVCVVANQNSPEQYVISGHLEAVRVVSEAAKVRGAKRVVPLAVSGAFHSSLMAGAAVKFSAALSAVAYREPNMPVISNVTARPIAGPASLPSELAGQLTSPVLWVDSIRELVALGCDTFIELGPGNTLSGLARRIAEGVRTQPVGDSAGLEKALGLIGAAV